MPTITFTLTDDVGAKLATAATGEERTPDAQAKVFVLESLGLRQKQAIAKVPVAARGARGKSSNGASSVVDAEVSA